MSRLTIEKKILTGGRKLEFLQPPGSFRVALRPGAEAVIKAASELGTLYTLTDSTVSLIRCTCVTLGIANYFEEMYSTRDEDRLPPQVAEGTNPWVLITKHPPGYKLKSLGVESDTPEHIIYPPYWDGRDEDPQPMLDLAQTLRERLK